MVLSWLLNSICKEISESLMYARSTRDLWLNIEAKYGESKGPLIYQFINAYYAILKRLWDELSVVHPVSPCSCDAGKLFMVVQFFMCLNEEYNHTKDHILLMDSMSRLNKVYSMLLRSKNRGTLALCSRSLCR